MSWFLGMKIEVSEDVVKISQVDYINRMLEKFGMKDCKQLSTPIAEKVSAISGGNAVDNGQYRAIVGSINYLACSSRPDIAFAAHFLSGQTQDPKWCHWVAAKHVLRYLQGAKREQLTYRKCHGGLKLLSYSDSDYANKANKHKSVSGDCSFLGENTGAVSWASKLQGVVADSTTHAETNAA